MKTLLLTTAFAFSGLFVSAQSYNISTVAGNGAGGYYGDGGSATLAELYQPFGVAVDNAGNIYIADDNNKVVRKVNTLGVITTFAGTGTPGYSGDGNPATAAELNGPSGVVADGAGNVYIADESNSRVRKVTPGGIISTYAGTGTSGYSGDGNPATAAELNYPSGGLAIDKAGNLYIPDQSNCRIRKVTPGGIISTVAGNGSPGFYGDGSQATLAEIQYPFGVAIDKAGNMYIADVNNQRIRMVTAGGVISTFAGNGTSGYYGDGGQASAAELYNPDGVSVDAMGNIYIADAFNNRVRMVDGTNTINTIAGNGTAGYCCDGGPALSAELNLPFAVAIDTSSGNMFIAEVSNNRIRELTGPPLNVSSKIATEASVVLYPNPSNGVFTIAVKNEELKVKSIVEVYNMLGEKLYKASLNPSEGGTSITAISLPFGENQSGAEIYLYRVITETGSLISTGKFLIQK